ncbi:GTP cyclohydrolase II [Limibaculum sp. M0105]|uniref:GTP cyclohydrolase-2 n=1 Tax=Thermohalobaculum xanthum TaxID=2753746 RepID=A0A8J7M694_9RHOB|nr:GTP cyclohydrolase II [Thermohalobaculum xanthum]MBK0399119.1 GTP cyclohydrolase II [Thermohalobaculum xanthum]
MTLSLSGEELVSRARADLRIGAPIALVGAGDGAAGALVMAAETASDARLADFRALAPDAFDLAITHHRATTLKARAYDGTLARIALPADADAAWVMATADPSLDLATPLKGPYATRREGGAELHALALVLTKQARLLPAAVVAAWADAETVRRLAAGAGLTLLSADIVEDAAAATIRLREISGARVPTRFSEAGRVHVFRPDDGAEEHYAIEIGQPARDEPVLARLHSACFTGDVIGSLKCDCGPQLAAAMDEIATAGAGVLLYMNQEGRGIGLANKMRAYSLQDQGYDTVEANHRLGFEDDERDFRLGAAILKEMGFTAVRLMTNNPGKIAMMEASGVHVAERVPLRVGRNRHNADYLATKAAKSGHLL